MKRLRKIQGARTPASCSRPQAQGRSPLWGPVTYLQLSPRKRENPGSTASKTYRFGNVYSRLEPRHLKMKDDRRMLVWHNCHSCVQSSRQCGRRPPPNPLFSPEIRPPAPIAGPRAGLPKRRIKKAARVLRAAFHRNPHLQKWVIRPQWGVFFLADSH
jgi:hypothetical protein